MQLSVEAGGGAQPGYRIGTDDSALRTVPLRGTAFELGVQYVAGQVVREQPTRAVDYERASGQPLPHRRGVGADELGEEVLGGPPGDRAGDQAGEVRVAGNVAQK